jgi:hypothetical protein
VAIPETALMKMSDAQVELVLRHVDTAGLSPEEKRVLAAVLLEDLKASRQGYDFRPQRYRINKDTQKFVDPFGNATDEIRGVVLLKQKVRAYWKPGERRPRCSSLDCITGYDEKGEPHVCRGCPYDQWGSASTDAEERKGKACKEMRRIYMVPENGFYPILVTLPPTSIAAWDNFCSARITQGISDLAMEVVLQLVPASTGSYDYSVLKPKNGRRIPPAEILRYHQIQKMFVESWKQAEVTAEDYETADESVLNGDGADDELPF